MVHKPVPLLFFYSKPDPQMKPTELLPAGEDGQRSVPGIYASGDVVSDAKIVVEAVRFSKEAAEAMVEYMEGESKKEEADTPLVEDA